MKKQKSIFGYFLLVCTCLLFSGCPLGSRFAITEPGKTPLDSRLLGVWIPDPEAAEKDNEIRFIVFDESHYYVEVQEEGKVKERYAVHPSKIGDTVFINVRDMDEHTDMYTYLTYEFSESGALTFRFLEDELFPEEIKSARVLRKIIKKNLNTDKLFSDPSLFLRRSIDDQVDGNQVDPTGFDQKTDK